MNETYRLEQTPPDNFDSSFRNKCPIELAYYDEATGERKHISVLIYEVISPTHFKGAASNNRIVEIRSDKFSAEIMFTGWLVEKRHFYYPAWTRRFHEGLFISVSLAVSFYFIGALSHVQLQATLMFCFWLSMIIHGSAFLITERDDAKNLYLILALASLAILPMCKFWL